MERLGLALLRLLAPLPLPFMRGLGWLLGQLLYWLVRPRRKVALTNLRLCFPHWTEQSRRQLARRNFVVFCQSVLDRAWLWHAPAALVRRRLHMHGAIGALQQAGGVVIFAPHFYGMDAGGSAVMQHIDRPGCTIYSAPPSPVLDAWMRAGRARFGRVDVIARTDGTRPVIRALRAGHMLYLLPDMDLGPEESVFVPFFGVPTATVPSLSRLARLGRARVVPVITRLTRSGYDVQVLPAWDNFPTADPVADAARMNRELEHYIETMPEQYYWVHRRFKTRPAGASSVY